MKKRIISFLQIIEKSKSYLLFNEFLKLIQLTAKFNPSLTPRLTLEIHELIFLIPLFSLANLSLLRSDGKQKNILTAGKRNHQ